MNNEYYSKNSKQFIEDTFNADMSEMRNLFISNLPPNATSILDLGFGSGRDSLAFQKQYNVTSLDPVKEFCEHGREIGLKRVICCSAQDMPFENEFDGIWACASLLHVPSNELNDVFKKCAKSLKNGAIMYVSFKLGNFEGERKGRVFLDLDENSLNGYLLNTSLNVKEIKITEDVRPDREEKWLNVFLEKCN